jgi:hypothetical protein
MPGDQVGSRTPAARSATDLPRPPPRRRLGSRPDVRRVASGPLTCASQRLVVRGLVPDVEAVVSDVTVAVAVERK